MPTLTKKQQAKVEKKALQESRAQEKIDAKAAEDEAKALKKHGLDGIVTDTNSTTSSGKGKGKATKPVKDTEATALSQVDKDRLDFAFQSSQRQRRASLEIKPAAPPAVPHPNVSNHFPGAARCAHVPMCQ
jgi:hypothetical protein